MLAVQVEKDPKTGAAIVRSVTPVSGQTDPQSATTIFDDGRKSIHAVGGSVAQPSSEELSQILSAIDGVGMTALLDDIAIMPTQETAKVEVTQTGLGNDLSSNLVMSTVNNSKDPDFKEKDTFENVPKTIDETKVKQKTLGIDSSSNVEVTESEMLCKGPVTLMFMGYTDGRTDGEDLEAEEPQGMLTAERVIITDDGEELVIGTDSIVPSQKPAEDMAAQKATKESQDKAAFQDVPLEGQMEWVPQRGEEGGNEQEKSESIAEGQGKPKRKTCQCCTGRTSLLTLSPQQTDNREASDRNADYINGTWKFKDENRTPFPPCHRLSAAETFTEKQFQKSSQMKQDLQRAEGVSDLTENPDILEIPFKSNICLEPLPTRADCAPTEEWHFSEQKMQKEIRQDMQREMVLVNLGKIPGGYSKGESRQMKDTKLLFEAFQQVKIEGPTRIRKNMGSLPKRPLYPSVLERTHSLEMFSQKTSPMLRTHSFHLVSASEKEKYPETFRPLSPWRSSKQEPAREGSPLLKENPFFKLRPALSLQPEVEKDIREAKKREEELRKQRSSLYGDMMQGSRDDGRSTAELKEVKVQRGPGHKTSLWQRWESGFINRQSSTNNN
uniref:Uncharacterized protein n=1 Tax=Periophthalmus magnuspinnatus TaxID=409849 RepID=A0A3B4BDL6_9GOBI